MPTPKGQIGLGSIISLGGVTGTANETFTTIGEVMSAKASGATASVTKYSTLDGGIYTQKISAIRDAGTWDLQIVHNSGDAGQTALAAAFANAAGQPYDFKVQLPIASGQATNGDLVTFSAIISKLNLFASIEVDKVIMSEVTLDLIALPVTTPGS
jgi:hypothetical protein